MSNFTIQGRQYTARWLVEQFTVAYNEALKNDTRLHCRWLPDPHEIPSMFFEENETMWAYFTESWYRKGLNENQKAALKSKVGINKIFATQLIQKHINNDAHFDEAHCIAGCAYLASLLFEELR